MGGRGYFFERRTTQWQAEPRRRNKKKEEASIELPMRYELLTWKVQRGRMRLVVSTLALRYRDFLGAHLILDDYLREPVVCLLNWIHR